jgi:hypothetical protein
MNPDEAHSDDPGKQAAVTGCVCPQCGALLYSHRSRLCGQCGAVLPRELILTDAEVEARDQGRQWARDLADKFGATGRASTSAGSGHSAGKPGSAEDKIATAEAAVRRMSFASEFKYRKRPTWFYVAGCSLTFLMFAGIFWVASRIFPLNRQTIVAFCMLGGMNIFPWFVMWRNAMPICPSCHQNIRLCLAEYCQVCGKPLSHQRCTDCGVDNSWIGWFHPSSNGAFRRITCCPGCGVELDTWIRRWQAGD